jgi:hypothetical protein
MENFNMNQINKSINNLEYNTIILSLYKKDELMRINPFNQIMSYIKKLNYYNINSIEENKEYIITKLVQLVSEELYKDWESNIKIHSINELIEVIKNTQEYKDFVLNLNYKINRAFILSKFLKPEENTFNFYNALTLDELNKIIDN